MGSVTVFDRNAHAYDRWFDDNPSIYQAELEALRALAPATGMCLEVGVGTGRFAAPLNIRLGIDPSRAMGKIARDRGIAVCQAWGERLPFGGGQFDTVMLVTVDPFVDDVGSLLREIRRVLRPDGRVVVGILDRDSPLGRLYDAHKASDEFYREARFHSTGEIIQALCSAGFKPGKVYQTLIGGPGDSITTEHVEQGFQADALSVQPGYGRGAFVALEAQATPGSYE